MSRWFALSACSLVAVAAACSSSSPDNGMGSVTDIHKTDAGMPMGGGMLTDAGMNMDMDGMAMPSGDMGSPGSVPVAAITTDAVFVVNGGGQSISVVDPATGAVIRTIKLTNVMYPHHIYLSPDGSMLSVADPGMDLSGGHHGGMTGMHGAVLILDAKTGATMASRRLDAMNHNAAFSPDGMEVWTSSMTMGGKVLVLDAMTLKTKVTINVGDMPAEVTFSRDGKHAFVANGMSNDVTVIDAMTKAVVKTIPAGTDPVGAWPGADGVMYVDCEEGKSLTAIDATSLAVVRSYNLGFTPGMAKTTPSGDALWVTNGDDGKVVFDMTTMDMKMGDTATGAGAHGIAFSTDGSLGFITNQFAGTLSIVDVGSGKIAKTVTIGLKPNGIVFRSK